MPTIDADAMKTVSRMPIALFLFNNWRSLLVATAIFGTAAGGSFIGIQTMRQPSVRLAGAALLADNASAATQYQLTFERLSAQLTRQSTRPDTDLRALTDLVRLLQERYRVLNKPALVRAVSVQSPDYRDDIVKLGVFMEEAEEGIRRAESDSRVLSELAYKFDKRLAFVDAFTHKARAADQRQRGELLESSATSAKSALTVAIILAWSLALACFILWVRSRDYKLKFKELSQRANQSAAQAEIASEAADAKNHLLAMVTHELGTPVQSIISGIQLIDLQYKNVVDHDTLDRILTSANQLENLIKDLMDWARLDSGRLQLKNTVFSPGELVKKIASNYQNAARKKGLTLLCDPGNTRYKVSLDELRFQQIITNLITNAIKYSDKGTINVSLRFVRHDERDQLRLTVEDNGPGISKEMKDAVFNPFTQVDQSSSRKFDGAGMGLAIVKRLLELLSGTIELHSELGHGARFEVRIDTTLIKEHDAPKYQIQPERVSAPVHVLLVDDHIEVLQSLQALLEHLGYTCDTADNGARGVELALKHKYDVILLDVNMPEMDGFAVAEAIRTKPGPNTEAPVIAISASAERFKDRPNADMFTDFLIKPIRHEKLHPVLLELTS